MRQLYKTGMSALLCLWGFLPGAKAQSDPVCIRFRQGSSVIERAAAETASLPGEWSESLHDGAESTLRIRLRGAASPDGSTATSERLAEERAEAVREWLCEEKAFPREVISVEAVGIDWQGLEALVAADASCPARAEVLEILRETPEWICDDQDRVVDGRKKQLMELQGGVPYKYMAERLFPALRCVVITAEGWNAPAPERLTAAGETAAQAAEPGFAEAGMEETGFAEAGAALQTDAVAEAAELPARAQNGPQAGTPAVETPEAGTLAMETPEAGASAVGAPAATQPEPTDADEAAAREPLHRLAIKTNLLYDAILMPSLEVEYRIDDRWSVAVEGDVAWWKRDRAHKYYQISTILAEGRYWFHTREPWHGHYVGVFAGGSWYDLENGARGYKGEFWTAGISYGYMFPIGRSWSLEAGLGVGFLRTRYEEYLPLDGHYVYQQTSRTNWLGPVKVKFALVCRLWDINRKGGRQ